MKTSSITAPTPVVADPSAGPPAKILVVDDDDAMRQSIAAALKAAKYEAVEASNGLDAITQAHEHLPDLIVSDYQMPGLTGYMLLGIFRRTSHLAAVPFILITGETAKADQRQSMNIGADDYLAKPFAMQDLLTTVNARLAKARAVREHSERRFDELRINLSRMLPHELNTPLVGICGLVELLREDFDRFSRQEISEFLDLLHQSAERLRRTVNNYLAVADFELARHDPEKVAVLGRGRAVNAGGLACHYAQNAADRHQRTADLKCQAMENIVARIGPEQLARVIDELVDNACKFSLAGTPIRVTVNIQEARAEFVVADCGCGMTPEQIVSIGAFVQFDRKRREQQGSGIGLCAARRITEVHGGTLAITSTPGVGATATVLLPLAAEEPPA